MKKISLCKMSYVPEPYSHRKNKIKFELDLSNYATKYNSKGVTGIDRSQFGKKFDLANLKSDVDDLDINQLKTVPADLRKLSNVVKKMLLKRLGQKS